MPKSKRSKSSAQKRASNKAASARSSTPAKPTKKSAKKPAPKAGAKARLAARPTKSGSKPSAKPVGARSAMTRVVVKPLPKGTSTKPTQVVTATARAEAAARITAAKGKTNARKRSTAAAKAAPPTVPQKAQATAAAAKAAGPWPGRFVWHDLMTTDAAASQAFYVGLFGWQIEERPMSGFTYRMIHAGPGPIGGIVEEKNIPVSHWMPYVAVGNVDAAAKKCAQLGGSACVPPTDIPRTGRFAVVGDPQGAYFSLYKGLPESSGFDPDVPVVGRVCWNELLTSDPQAAQSFYSTLLGWQEEQKDMGPMGVYRLQKLGAAQAAGLMAHPQPGAPPCWLAYFLVDDLAAATAKAKQLGARAMVEMAPIPGLGAFSLLTDPVGAVFALFWMQAGACG